MAGSSRAKNRTTHSTKKAPHGDGKAANRADRGHRSDATRHPEGERRRDNGRPDGHRRSPAGRRAGRARPGTSWERAAEWYDGWVGKRGSVYHRRVALPVTLGLLDLAPGERLLDLGAGQGVLAPHAAQRGAEYLGIEASSRLVGLARERHGDRGRFLLGDARALPAEVGAGAFDAAVFLLSIQDMDPLDQVIAQAAGALRTPGRLVLFMVHPCFRVPRQSGWGFDADRKLPVRRVDRYLTPLAVPMGRSTSFHRPLEAYVTALAANGLTVDRLVELPDDEAWARRQGRTYNAEIPLFLALRAVKRAGGG